MLSAMKMLDVEFKFSYYRFCASLAFASAILLFFFVLFPLLSRLDLTKRDVFLQIVVWKVNGTA
jgi:hypothetical protein